MTITWQQDIWGASNNESIMSLFISLLFLQQRQKPIGDDDDDSDGILTLGKWPHEVDHTQEEILSFCTTQIH